MGIQSNQSILEPLKEREIEILRLIAEGLSNREIAQKLFISLETVKWYNKHAYGKLGVSSRTQAVAKAEEYGLLVKQPDAAAAPRTQPRHNLPVQITSFVGREHEIAEVAQLIQSSHLLTLTGPGGIGKTRLALQVASNLLAQFPDGVFFVDLAPIKQPDLVADTIANVLGMQDTAGLPVREALENFLAGKRMLLLLDNFEHIIAAAPLVGGLLSVSPYLRILITSREVLNIYGEWEYPVPPLAMPDLERLAPHSTLSEFEAVKLFIQRAQAVKNDFTFSDLDAAAIAEICVRLDGLPLAIELAAARVKLFSPSALLDQLENRFTTLRGGPGERPERQRALHSAIEWSYNLLTDTEKTLFNRLAVFKGGHTIESVETVCCHDLPINVLDGLESLLNKSLLRSEDGPAGEPRFVMLETIYEYARWHLEASDELQATKSRHAAYFLDLAERAQGEFRTGEGIFWARKLQVEFNNFRTALTWALQEEDMELAVRLVGELSLYWYYEGYHIGGYQWVKRVLPGLEAASKPAQLTFLLGAGQLAFANHDKASDFAFNSQALCIARELDDRLGVAWALIYQAVATIIASHPGEYDGAVARCEEGLEIFRELDYKPGIAHGLNILGELARANGQYERAQAIYEEVLPIVRETGEKRRESMILSNLGFIAYRQKDYERAESCFRDGLYFCLEHAIDWGVVCKLGELAGPLVIKGQPERAARLLGASEALMEAMGSRWQPGDEADYKLYIAITREQLDEDTFNTAWAEGRAMSVDEAVAYALGQDDLQTD